MIWNKQEEERMRSCQARAEALNLFLTPPVHQSCSRANRLNGPKVLRSSKPGTSWPKAALRWF